MSFYLQVRLTEEAQAMVARAKDAPDLVLRGLANGMNLAHQIAIGRIQSDYMSERGPDTLGVVTNRLRGSIRASKAAISGNVVTSAIGTNVKYMGVHEFGYSGQVVVKAHQRRNPGGDTFELAGTGRQVKRGAAEKQGLLTKAGTGRKKLGVSQVSSGGTSNVREHVRWMQMPERAPIRKGVTASAADYERELSEGVIESLRGGL